MIQISIRKNSGQDIRKSPEPARCFLSNLRADFRTVAEGENHPAVRIDRCVIHKPVEQLLIEIHRQLLRLAKPRKEATEKVILNSFPLPLFFQDRNEVQKLQNSSKVFCLSYILSSQRFQASAIFCHFLLAYRIHDMLQLADHGIPLLRQVGSDRIKV